MFAKASSYISTCISSSKGFLLEYLFTVITYGSVSSYLYVTVSDKESELDVKTTSYSPISI